ncbi:MAG: hypothetical protein LBN33_06535 [Desulfovibrio sp.]|jgi:cell fate regulator YaaT (PSP1 superfamily)|nr:hypothetical protein [Desulfovibrio sp.]
MDDAVNLEDGEDGKENLPSSSFSGEHEDRGRRVLGVRLRKAGQVFFFLNEELEVRIGSKVLLNSEQGQVLGEVESILYGGDAEFAPDKAQPDTMFALATASDIAMQTENAILAAEAAAFCKTCVRQRGLDMKLVDVEVMHDRSKIIFYFTAPARIDFRELVKDLVRNYRTRIELRQIGVRHETQMIGALGNCGMVCCCHRYLRKFAPVTIRMAKEQNLFPNPVKLSGMCGRLLCCLSFEQENYEQFNKGCPKLGKKYNTSKGAMRILRANMFSRTIAAVADSGEETEFSLEEWESLHARRTENVLPGVQTESGLDPDTPANFGAVEAAGAAYRGLALEEEGSVPQDDELDFPPRDGGKGR